MNADEKTNEEPGVRGTSLKELSLKLDALSVDMALIKNLLLTQCKLLESGSKKRPRVPRTKPVHKHTRCNIGKPWEAQLEVNKATRLFKALRDYNGQRVFTREKWVGRTFDGTILEHEKLRTSTTAPNPSYFDSFFKTLILNPHNACFFLQAERPYVCMADDDRWNRVLKRDQFWEMLRFYLWETYRRYVDLCIGEILIEFPERESVLDDLSKAIQHRNRDDIPLRRSLLLAKINCMLSYGSTPSNISILRAAYVNRKK